MSDPRPGHHYDDSLEEQLEQLPDKIGELKLIWRSKTLEREKTDAILHAQFKGENPERTASDIKALINASKSHYDAVMEEIIAEAKYEQICEKHMANKKLASLRTAY